MKRYLLALLTLWTAVTAGATANDSLQAAIIDSLQGMLYEMKANELLLQSVLAEKDQEQRADSIKHQQIRHRIDSLRRVTKGVPLVFDRDTILYIYASKGGQSAEFRIHVMKQKMEKIGKSLGLTSDSIYIFESEHSSDIMYGEVVLMQLSDLDGLWSGTTRQELAQQNMDIITRQIARMQAEYGLTAKLRGLGWAVLLVVAQIVLFFLTRRFIAHLRKKIVGGLNGRLKPVVIRGYEFLNIRQWKKILLFLTRMLQVVLIVLQLIISLPLLFSIFPETESFTWRLLGYVWDPLRDMFLAFVNYFPSLVKIFVILFVVNWLLRVVRHFADEISNGNIKMEGFYADWAHPTYQIVRIFAIAFSLIVIWPLLPGSDSGIFKGVSIFVAALFSLGSTTTIGNLISGLIITYMRPFLVGDFVRIGDSEGIVVEKNAFITRLRDIKDNIITVPNNSILSMQTVNYTAAARHQLGSIVHSDFTFTYKVPRATIEQYLLEAASRCTLLQEQPKPFVLVTALEDFYSRYQINAYTMETHRLFEVYSELHKNILDVFREHDLEPTSSHFVSVKESK